MAHRMIGLEFGADTLKIALVRGSALRKAAIEKLPDGLIREGRPTSAAALVDFLRAALKRHGIRGGSCALVLPGSLLIAQHVTMPVMDRRETELNLPYEFRDFVGRDGGKYLYDYTVTALRGKEMELYAAAVLKEAVEEYSAILKRAGLKLKVAIPAEMAWANLLRQSTGLPRELCIVDLGHNTARVNIFDEGCFVMGKDIEMAGSHLDKRIAAREKVDISIARSLKEENTNQIHEAPYLADAYQALTVEVLKVAHFYSYSGSSRGGQPEHLYYCGGCSGIGPLRAALEKGTGMALHSAAMLVNGADLTENMAMRCALAAGAAMQQ